jgi:hypothetical protein
MKTYLSILALIVLMIPAPGYSQTAKKINEIASKALDEGNLIEKDGVIKLYGTQTNGADTKEGDWACAKVATIILREAGVVKEISLGVRDVESALDKWVKIYDEKDLKPGDVIVWVNRFTGRKDKRCTGGGNCHVGIVTGKGYFHNSPISNAPTFDGISLWAFKFKHAFRPPN